MEKGSPKLLRIVRREELKPCDTDNQVRPLMVEIEYVRELQRAIRIALDLWALKKDCQQNNKPIPTLQTICLERNGDAWVVRVKDEEETIFYTTTTIKKT